ncbi:MULTISPECIES: hypothetical protein [unclassified Streptomyces]|uniref:hypothetical protein n=1 Tax=unclassified Streptomyces TaxID=2593676 RepID=UPI001F036279|nr:MULTISPECIES: hypothetical protein [unclassified Streptomyces]MCH0566245.1 hypothetical protein [Streptomyces sp. MUM 2J]MCH0568412.1 hypothetical protein [Streptomyces sp. MUM 136J]
MHVVIAWWEQHRNGTGISNSTARQGMPSMSCARSEERASFTADVPGLQSGQWITDPAADLQGLALIWDSAASADLNLPDLCDRTFGCAPSHRWAFELSDASPQGDTRSLPTELNVLLHA